jgi:hypothetical protein
MLYPLSYEGGDGELLGENANGWRLASEPLRVSRASRSRLGLKQP